MALPEIENLTTLKREIDAEHRNSRITEKRAYDYINKLLKHKGYAPGDVLMVCETEHTPKYTYWGAEAVESYSLHSIRKTKTGFEWKWRLDNDIQLGEPEVLENDYFYHPWLLASDIAALPDKNTPPK